MRLLLDTHVLIWAATEPERLTDRTLKALRSHVSVVSHVSLWEIAIKVAKGRLAVRDDLPDWLESSGFEELPILKTHLWAVRKLPDLHGDPFDRLLVAQARVEDLILVTVDRALAGYDVKILTA